MIKNGEILKVHRNAHKIVCVVEIGFPYHDEIKKLYKDDMVKHYYDGITKQIEERVGYNLLYPNPEFVKSVGTLLAQAIYMNFKFGQERIEKHMFSPMLYVQKSLLSTNFPHNHTIGGSSMSTTFYIDPPERGGEIRFYISPNPQPQGESITIKTRPNVLYVFPAWLHHAPLPHSGTETRVCVNVDYFTFNRPVFVHEQEWGKANTPERRPVIQGWENRPYSIW